MKRAKLDIRLIIINYWESFGNLSKNDIDEYIAQIEENDISDHNAEILQEKGIECIMKSNGNFEIIYSDYTMICARAANI